SLAERTRRPHDRGAGSGSRRLAGLVEVRDLVRRVHHIEPGTRLTQRPPQVGLGAEDDTSGTARCRLDGAGGDFRQAAIGAERVYRDCCDEPSEESLSATTWRPP